MRRTLALTLAAAAACGGGSSSSGNNNGGGTTFSAACDQVVAALFARQQACTQANPDVASVLQSGQASFCVSLLGKETGGTRVDIDTTKASACATAIQSTACSLIGFGPPGTCAGFATPKVSVGQDCYDDIECQSGSCDNSATCPGKCQAVGALNGACPCGAGLYCDTTGAPICKALKTSGACGADDECTPGYLCRGATTRSCVAAVGLGVACTPGSANACASGYYCDGSKCAAVPKLGQACIAVSPGAYAAGIMIGCYCTSSSPTCTAFKARSGSCTQQYECDVFAGDFCNTVTGKCEADSSAVCLPP